jgi:hypothetical protein
MENKLIQMAEEEDGYGIQNQSILTELVGGEVVLNVF